MCLPTQLPVPSPKVYARLEVLTAARYFGFRYGHPRDIYVEEPVPPRENSRRQASNEAMRFIHRIFTRGSIFRQLDRNDDVNPPQLSREIT